MDRISAPSQWTPPLQSPLPRRTPWAERVRNDETYRQNWEILKWLNELPGRQAPPHPSASCEEGCEHVPPKCSYCGRNDRGVTRKCIVGNCTEMMHHYCIIHHAGEEASDVCFNHIANA